MFPLVDEFEVQPLFEDRQHERHQFKLVIEGRKYKGDYCDGEIQWLNPHPQQVITEQELQALEAEVHLLLDKHGVRDETDDMEVEPMVNNSARQFHVFKLKIQGEEFKGTFLDGVIEWFHPKPAQKINDDRVEKIEEKVQEKMKDHLA